MASVKVRAIEECHYNNELKKPGAEFLYDEKLMKKDDKGKGILPWYVEAVDSAAKPAEKPADKSKDGADASAAGKEGAGKDSKNVI